MANPTWNDRAERLWLLKQWARVLRFHGLDQCAEACEAEHQQLRDELLREAA